MPSLFPLILKPFYQCSVNSLDSSSSIDSSGSSSSDSSSTDSEYSDVVSGYYQEKQDIPLNKKSLTCQKCGMNFVNKRNLNRHIGNIHLGNQELKFKCTECEKQYGEHSNLRRHINSVHKQLKPFKCTEWEKQ